MTNDMALTRLDEYIRDLQKVRELAATIVDVPGKLQPVASNSAAIRIDVRSLDELHAAREYLRSKFGTWNDDIVQVFGSGASGVAIYGNDTEYELWLFFDPKSPPDGLVKPGCRFVERTTTDYNFVCDNR